MPPATTISPASGPALKSDISAALGFLSKWCLDRGINEKSPDDENIRILLALLMQSGERLCGTILPKVPKHIVAIPARVELSERRWKRFTRWFEEEYEQPMLRHCRAKGAGALIPQRESTGRGGRGNRYEAQYFLSYADSPSDDGTGFGSSNIDASARETSDVDLASAPAPARRRRQKTSTAIFFMVFIALIAFMSLLSLIASKGGTQVFVFGAGQTSDSGSDGRKR